MDRTPWEITVSISQYLDPRNLLSLTQTDRYHRSLLHEVRVISDRYSRLNIDTEHLRLFSNLEVLDLRRVSMRRGIRDLTVLPKLRSCLMPHYHVILGNNPNLQHLYAYCIYRYQDQQLNLPSLRSLVLEPIVSVLTRDNTVLITESEICALTTLTTLVYTRYRDYNQDNTVSFSSLTNLRRLAIRNGSPRNQLLGLTNLQHLHYCGMNSDIEDGNHIWSLIDKLPNLASIDDINDMGDLAKIHTNLTELHLTPSDYDVTLIANLTKLESLRVLHLTDRIHGIINPTILYYIFQSLPNLEVTYIDELSKYIDCHIIDDESFPNLKYVIMQLEVTDNKIPEKRLTFNNAKPITNAKCKHKFKHRNDDSAFHQFSNHPKSWMIRLLSSSLYHYNADGQLIVLDWE